MSRMELEKSFKNHLIDMKGCLDKVIQDAKSEMMLKEIEIRYETGTEELRILGDEKLLERAIANVVSNAVRYANSVVVITAGIVYEQLWIKFRMMGRGLQKVIYLIFSNVFIKEREVSAGLALP